MNRENEYDEATQRALGAALTGDYSIPYYKLSPEASLRVATAHLVRPQHPFYGTVASEGSGRFLGNVAKPEEPGDKSTLLTTLKNVVKSFHHRRKALPE